jgi:hypothetical protein
LVLEPYLHDGQVVRQIVCPGEEEPALIALARVCDERRAMVSERLDTLGVVIRGGRWTPRLGIDRERSISPPRVRTVK